MWDLLNLIASLFSGYRGYREDKQGGRWSWAKFSLVLGFGALETGLILAPALLPFTSSFFLPAFLASVVIALANFAWFIPLVRRWKTTGSASSSHSTSSHSN